MNKCKRGLRILGLFVVLILVAVFPLGLMSFNNKKLIDKINVSAISDEELRDTSSNIDFNTLDRLVIISTAQTGASGAVSEYSLDTERTPLYDVEVMDHVHEQIRIMQEYKALPSFELNNKRVVRIMRKNYLDTRNSQKSVVTWYIQARYEGVVLNVHMDAETFLIYDIEVVFDEASESYTQQASLNKFLEYLKIKVPGSAYKNVSSYFSFEEYGFPFGYQGEVSNRSVDYRLILGNSASLH